MSPYSEPRPASFPVRILYDGHALPGALVKLINLEQDLASVDARRSDTMGLATFPMPETGSWLVSVVWTKPLENSPEADFETIFASLTFGRQRPGSSGDQGSSGDSANAISAASRRCVAEHAPRRPAYARDGSN